MRLIITLPPISKRQTEFSINPGSENKAQNHTKSPSFLHNSSILLVYDEDERSKQEEKKEELR